MLTQLVSRIEKMIPRKRKKVIEDWDFIMVFEEYYRGEVEIIMASFKCKDDVQWEIVENKLENQILVLLKMSDKVVKQMAHQLKILKKKDKKSYQIRLKDLNTLIYTTDKQANPNAYNYLCFLRARLSPRNSQIYQQQKYSVFNKNKEEMYIKQENGKLFTFEEEIRAKYHFLLTYTQKIQNKQNPMNALDTSRQPFISMMRHPGFIELVPIQRVSQLKTIILNNNSLKNYLGPNIDCYFSFVNFMQKWLIFPMIVGIITTFLNYYYEYSADNSPFDFIYALFIMVWSILFITRWEENQKWNKVKESCGTSQLWTEYQHMISTKRLQRHYSLVSGQIQYYMSLKTRILLIITSNALSLLMMFGTLTFIIYSLNARGFIDPHHKLFYSQTISGWAKEGGIFDRNTMLSQIPNIIHVIVINGFDQNVYRPAVKWLAKFQKHQSRRGYENSIVVKYFIYQFVITFADLFYIAFVRLDIQGLRQQLLSLFFIDIVRRIVAESLIPFIKKRHRSYTIKSKGVPQSPTKVMQQRKSYFNNQMSVEDELHFGAILQVNKQHYEPFDDYLQIITNFGYLVMLSSCFPLAPLLIMIAHGVQAIQDKYKIIHLFKRKLPQSYVGMSNWKDIIVFICYISIVTNIMLFAFSSQQVVNFFPKMYEGGKDLLYGNTDIQTLIEDAATGILQTVLPNQNQTNFLNTTHETHINGFSANISEIQIKKFDQLLTKFGSATQQCKIGFSEQCKNQLIKLQQQQLSRSPISQIVQIKNKPFVLQQFKPPKKQAETTFIVILFFIQHFFLVLFVLIRYLLQKRKSEAQIFAERKQYKRRIKKNLPKNILSILSGHLLVNQLLIKEMGVSKNVKQNQNQKTRMEPSKLSETDTKDTDTLRLSSITSQLKYD